MNNLINLRILHNFTYYKNSIFIKKFVSFIYPCLFNTSVKKDLEYKNF